MRIYNFLLNLFFPLFALLFALASVFHPRLRKNFFQRFGFLFIKKGVQRPVWFHCSSLGELNAVRNIVSGILKVHGEVYVTLLTDTGLESAEKMLGSSRCSLLPLDFSFLIRGFIRKLDPLLLVIEETELWPNLICQTGKAGVPVLYTNCIITDRSFRVYRLFPSLFRRILRTISFFFVQNPMTRKHLLALGADKKRIRYTGNIKFDLSLPAAHEAAVFRKKISWGNKPVLAAGSTREGEEALLLDIFLKLKKKFKSAKMVLAPRHLSRLNEVRELLRKHQVRTGLFSRARGDFDVLLVDRMGVLYLMYALADLCFIGGTLVPAGGHNPLEAAFYKKPVLSGPHIQNNRESFLKIARNRGGYIAKTKEELYGKLKILMADRRKRKETGGNAFRVIAENQGASQRIVRYIRENYLS